ncbi:response regulator, partial [bacterium]|nr:response regulator [bacterium]
MSTKSILIVDDEVSVRTSLEKALSKAGYVTRSAGSGNEALRILAKAKTSFNVVLSDLKMPDGDGLDLLRGIKKHHPKMEVVLLTGYGTIERAVEAMKEGAYDFITKPF